MIIFPPDRGLRLASRATSDRRGTAAGDWIGGRVVGDENDAVVGNGLKTGVSAGNRTVVGVGAGAVVNDEIGTGDGDGSDTIVGNGIDWTDTVVGDGIGTILGGETGTGVTDGIDTDIVD